MNKTILVIDGAGFLGAYLCDRLFGEGHGVICIDILFTGFKDDIRQLIYHD